MIVFCHLVQVDHNAELCITVPSKQFKQLQHWIIIWLLEVSYLFLFYQQIHLSIIQIVMLILLYQSLDKWMHLMSRGIIIVDHVDETASTDAISVWVANSLSLVIVFCFWSSIEVLCLQSKQRSHKCIQNHLHR